MWFLWLLWRCYFEERARRYHTVLKTSLNKWQVLQMWQKLRKWRRLHIFLKIRNGKLHIYKSGAHHSVIWIIQNPYRKRPFLNKNYGICYDFQEILVLRDRGRRLGSLQRLARTLAIQWWPTHFQGLWINGPNESQGHRVLHF